MKSRHILLVMAVILGTWWHPAAAQPKKKKIQVDAPPLESILASSSVQSNPVEPGLIRVQPEMPLGPQDILKSYEIAMSLVTEKTSSDFAVIVQAQRANQITRDQAEYLLQQQYQMAMMQYQVLSALHDVLKHDMETSEQAKRSFKAAGADEVLVVPLPASPSGPR